MMLFREHVSQNSETSEIIYYLPKWGNAFRKTFREIVSSKALLAEVGINTL
jgi:hypothetical protein